MKTTPFLILVVVIVAAGIFLYDQVIRGDAAPPTADGPTLLADASGGGAPELGSGALPRILQRLEHLEGKQSLLEQELAKIRAAFPKSGTVDISALRKLVPPSEGEFDDSTLDALQAGIEEVKKRARKKHMRNLAQRNLDRLDLRLNEAEQTRVVEAVLAYQAQGTTFWKDMVDRGITDRKEQLAELAKLQEQFRKDLSHVVPEQDLDRAVDGLIGRGSLIRQPDSGPRRLMPTAVDGAEGGSR